MTRADSDREPAAGQVRVPEVSHRRRRDRVQRRGHRRDVVLAGRYQDRLPAPGEREVARSRRRTSTARTWPASRAVSPETTTACDGGRAGDAIVFISDRDHPYATGNAGGGFGQELYAMKPDGSQPTRLTISHAWATNYHVNWSPDGHARRLGEHRVLRMGRDGGRLRVRRLGDAARQHSAGSSTTRPGGRRTASRPTTSTIITTSTRAGFQSTDVYAIDITTPAPVLKRLTDSPAWDEHGHLLSGRRARSRGSRGASTPPAS